MFLSLGFTQPRPRFLLDMNTLFPPPISTIKSCLLYTKFPKTPNYYRLAPRMATTAFVEMLDNLRHLTRFILESRSCSQENVNCKYVEDNVVLFKDDVYIITKFSPFCCGFGKFFNKCPLIGTAVGTSETSVNFYQISQKTTNRLIQERREEHAG